ncbi:SDR family oxidoreductase [bacterium]|nr:SDR family oxidoreductase [bacterium]
MKNRNALLFGATGGIGEAICQELCAQDFDCYLIGRSAEKLNQLKKKFRLPPEHIFCSASMTTPAGYIQTRKWLESLNQTFPVAVHAAGQGMVRRASKISLEEWQAMMDINLNSAFAFFKLSWEFRADNRFELVYFGSASVDQVWPKNSLYGASKAGLEMFAKSLQKEIRPDGGRVWLYKPGSVRTGFFNGLPNHIPPEKMMDPRLIAKLVVDNLQSDQAIYFPEIPILSE